MDLIQVIRDRRSVRSFRPDPVPEEDIHAMLEAARLAPSGGNAQSHVIGVVTEPRQIEDLARAAGNQAWIAKAPLVFALCAELTTNLAGRDDADFALIVNKKRFGAELIEYLAAFPDQSAVARLFENAAPLIPGQHIVLTAVSRGLQACWVGHLDVTMASLMLGLPQTHACLFLLPVGYPATGRPQPEKKSIEAITFRDRWPASGTNPGSTPG